MAKRNNREHQEQVAVILWRDSNLGKYPQLKLLHAIPNGGKRNVAVARKLKAEGVKAGVCDLFLPVAKKGYHGLYIEMKIKPNTPKGKQKEFIRDVEEEGYLVYVCYNAEEAVEVLKGYLKEGDNECNS